jgi:phosphohistidine swiveling domain-containing protein
MKDLSGLFGSKSRTQILTLFLQAKKATFNVTQVVAKAKVNARLASSELKKLATFGILKSQLTGSSLFYSLNHQSPLVNPLREIFIDHEWNQWERQSRIHHMILTLIASQKPMLDYYGICWPAAHLVLNYDNVTWFFKPKEFIAKGKKLVPIYLKNKNQIWSDFETYGHQIGHYHNYPDFYANYQNFWRVAYIPELISSYIESLLKPGEQITLKTKSFTDRYEDLLWQLAKQATKTDINQLDLKPILKDYWWIKNSYYDVCHLTEEEVRTDIKKKMGKHKPTPVEIPDPKSLSSELLSVGQDMTQMIDTRKQYQMQAAGHLHTLLKDIGAPYGLSSAYMQQTLPHEVLEPEKYLPHLKPELVLRLRSCTITDDLDKGLQVFSGQILPPSGVQSISKFELHGRVACGGLVNGRAKIVYGTKDLSLVNHGDIIVSPMTSPDLMPAIRRCVAIVTDFGGMACHAAIVAREFNLPCIVGTGEATKLIHNNDLIEVDANTGKVKILQTSAD